MVKPAVDPSAAALAMRQDKAAALVRSQIHSMASGPALFTHAQLVLQDCLLTKPGPIREIFITTSISIPGTLERIAAAVSPRCHRGKANSGKHLSPPQGNQAIQVSFLAICFIAEGLTGNNTWQQGF